MNYRESEPQMLMHASLREAIVLAQQLIIDIAGPYALTSHAHMDNWYSCVHYKLLPQTIL